MQLGGVVLLYVVLVAGALGVPLKRLRSAETQRRNQIDDRQRLHVLQDEQQEFVASGGPELLDLLAEGSGGELPTNLSRTDLHGAVTLLAQVSGLELTALSVGEFKHIEAAQLDDAVAKCEVNLSASGGADGLSTLVATLRGLSYPTIVEEFQLSRQTIEDTTFSIHATLGLFQSIPIQNLPESGLPDQEIPQ